MSRRTEVALSLLGVAGGSVAFGTIFLGGAVWLGVVGLAFALLNAAALLAALIERRGER